MADPQTANLQLFTPVNGADPGSWDVPVNANWNQLEAVLTTNAAVTLSNLPITLSAGQYNNTAITFSGTLTGNVTVTFPAFARIWTLFNNCGAATNFSVTCKTTSSTIFVALPPGEPIQVYNDGTNIRFLGLGRVGQYLDMGSTAVPLWITASTPAPYLNCNGTTFSSATYPNLRDYLGSNTLPDSKGRFRATLDQSAGRLSGTSSSNGLDGTALSNAGGNQLISTDNIPAGTLYLSGAPNVGGATFGIAVAIVNSLPYAPPSYVGGLTLIRAG